MQSLTQGKDLRRKLHNSQQSKMMNLIKNQNLLRTDWFPMTRDTIFLTCLLPSLYEMARTGSSSVKSAIQWWQALILILLYCIHLLIMKYNRLYEKLIRHKITSINLERKLKHEAKKDIKRFHWNLQIVVFPKSGTGLGDIGEESMGN